MSPLYLGGVMALVGSAIGAACAILTKIPTAEIRLGLHGFNQVLVMIASDEFPAANLAVLPDRCLYDCGLFAVRDACPTEVLWYVGATCFNRAICVHCMGRTIGNIRVREYSCRYWLVTPLNRKRASSPTTPLFCFGSDID